MVKVHEILNKLLKSKECVSIQDVFFFFLKFYIIEFFNHICYLVYAHNYIKYQFYS